MNLLEKVLKEKPLFSDEIIEPLEDTTRNDAEMFALSHYWNGCGSVNVHEIIGSKHPDYYGNSWLNLLTNGKRMNINLRLLQENPAYYDNPVKKEPDMHFIKIDEKIYITHDGNHRSAIAKFLFYFEGKTMLHGINIHEYIMDKAFQASYNQCANIVRKQNLSVDLKIVKPIVKRTDSAGWMREYFDNRLLITHRQTDFKFEMDTADMKQFISESINPFRRFTGKYKKLWRK